MRKTALFFFVLAICFLAGGQAVLPASGAADFPLLKGPYLGQKPPGLEPELFAPGIINTGMYTRDVAMTPDGKEMYFCVSVGGNWNTILTTREVNGRWTEPEVAPHMDDPGILNFEPCIAPDGKKFYFLSTRPDTAQGETEGGQDIWAMDRLGAGWGEPYNLGGPVNTDQAEYFPSVTREGTLYFTRTEKGSRTSFIYRARWKEGRFQEPEKLPPQVNCGTSQFNAFIAPDESYIIVPVFGRKDSLGGTDYYIVFRGEDDTWSEPVNMGAGINTAGGAEFSPYVSPDGRYFFFMSSRFLPREEWPAKLSYGHLREAYAGMPNGNSAIYWVDARVIDSLRPRRPSLTYAVCAWHDAQVPEALALAESIRSFAGNLSRAPIRLYLLENSVTSDPSLARKCEELGVALFSFRTRPEDLTYPFAAKIIAAARAEEELAGKTDILVWMDPDTVVWREPHDFLLDKQIALGYRPVSHKLLGSSIDQPPDDFWSRLYSLLGVKPESFFPMITPVDRKTIRPYFNAGLLVLRPERGVLRKWLDAFNLVSADPVLQGMCRQDQRKRIFLHQAALAGAVLTSLGREAMTELSEAYNYPLNLHAQVPADRRLTTLDGLTTLRYDESEKVAALLEQSGLSGERVQWLLSHFPAGDR
jgi:hypothetical protein